MKYNTSKKVAAAPTATNEMGEKAYVLSAKEELVSTVLTTFLSDSYYETENEIVNRIKKAIKSVDTLFVAKLAVYARHKANMRSVSHLLAGELAERTSGSDWGKRFYHKVIGRPDDMSEILAYIGHKDGKANRPTIPNAIIKGFRQYMENMDAYKIDNYKMKNRGISLIDLVRVVHPKHKGNPKNDVAYQRLLKGESLSDLYTTKSIQKGFSEAGKADLNTGETVEELKGDAIKIFLDNKDTPIMQLLRNLRNILNYSPESTPLVIKHLTNKRKILNSKQLPFRFLTAYNEIEALTPNQVSTKSSVSFEKEENGKVITKTQIDQVLSALETAFNYSIENIPKLEGNTAILIDHSGSMRGDAHGSSKLSAFGKTSTIDVANLFGSMMMHAQDNVYIGLFGDNLINVAPDRTIPALKFAQHLHALGGSAGERTETGIYEFMKTCIDNKTKVDNLIIFSDQVIGSDGSASGKGATAGWYRVGHTRANLGTGGEFHQLFKQFKSINPKCSVVSVDLRQTGGKSVFNKAMNITQISGWSNQIFTAIESSSKGYDALMKEIESIVI